MFFHEVLIVALQLFAAHFKASNVSTCLLLGKCTETTPLKKVNGNTREISVDLHKIFTFEFVLQINYSLHSSSSSGSSDTVYLYVHQCAATQWQEAPFLVTQKTTTSLIYIYSFSTFWLRCCNAIILKIYFSAWLQWFGLVFVCWHSSKWCVNDSKKVMMYFGLFSLDLR